MCFAPIPNALRPLDRILEKFDFFGDFLDFSFVGQITQILKSADIGRENMI